MAAKPATATAADLVRQFAHFSDLSLTQPVLVTRNGRARNVLLSLDEYERLKKRDQLAFAASDTPDQFLAAIEALAGDSRR